MNPPVPGVGLGFVEELASANPSLMSVDTEIEDLEALLTQTTGELRTGLADLLKKIDKYEAPQSETLLEKRVDDERAYISHQIILLELKQIAESITRVTHVKRVNSSALESLDSDHPSCLGLRNRPVLLLKQLVE